MPPASDCLQNILEMVTRCPVEDTYASQLRLRANPGESERVVHRAGVADEKWGVRPYSQVKSGATLHGVHENVPAKGRGKSAATQRGKMVCAVRYV